MTGKETLRKEVAQKKKQYTADDLEQRSETIRRIIESLPLFVQAQNVLLYHSMAGEVQTRSMLSHWQLSKQCYLPQVEGDCLNIRKYEGENSLKKGVMGIWEPVGTLCTNLSEIDLIIVPGIAFDREGNRLGRGKGYYDRLLANLQAPTVGVCFHFQLVDKIPVEYFDIKMQYVITEEYGT